MAQTGYTPIQLYYSSTATNTPLASNLLAGELAINTADEMLYFKNSSGTVKLLASSASATGTVSSVALTVPSFLSVSGSPITTSGTLAVTLSGTALPTANGGTGQTTYTDGQLLIGNTLTGSLSKATISAGANVTITNGNGTITIAAASPGTGTVTSVGLSAPALFTVTNSPVTSSGTLTLSYSGTALPTANGGTGLTGFTAANNAIYSTSSSALTAGTLPTAAGGTGLTTFTAANNAIYSTSSSALAAGTLPVAAGGTGATSLTSGYLLVGAGTSAVTGLAPGTSGNLVVSNGSTWSSTTSGVTLTTPSITFSTTASVSAAGTTQGTATALTNDYNVVTTVGASSGVVLPTATVGRRIIVVNKGANALAIYPASGAAIDALAANAAISLAVGGVLEFNASSTTQWYSTTNTAINAAQLTGTVATTNGGTGLTGFGAANNAIYSTSASALAAGTLPVAAGGTGATSLTSGYVLVGAGTSAVTGVAPGTSGNVLTSNGTTWVSQASAGGGVTSITFGTTGLTPNTATTGAVTVAGTLAVGNGGTGSTTLTANSVMLGNGTSALSSNMVAPGSSGNHLISNGTTWTSAAQGSYTATASGSISANQLVLVNSSGQAVGVTGTNPAQTNVTFTATATGTFNNTSSTQYSQQIQIAVNSTGTTALAIYYDNAYSTSVYVRAATISGTTVTWGTAVSVGNSGNNGSNYCSAVSYDITAGRWVICYFLFSGSWQYIARLVSVSGNTSTLGNQVSLASNVLGNSINIAYDSVNNRHLVVHNGVSSTYSWTAQVVTVATTTISAGTATVINSGAYQLPSGWTPVIAYAASQGRFFIAYRSQTNATTLTSTGYVQVVTTSTTTPTFGTALITTFEGSTFYSQYNQAAVWDSTRSRFILFSGSTYQEFSIATTTLTLVTSKNITFPSNNTSTRSPASTTASGLNATSGPQTLGGAVNAGVYYGTTHAYYNATSNTIGVLVVGTAFSFTNSYIFFLKYNANAGKYICINGNFSIDKATTNNPQGNTPSFMAMGYVPTTNTVLVLNTWFNNGINYGCGCSTITNTQYGIDQFTITAPTTNIDTGTIVGVSTAAYTNGQTATIAAIGGGGMLTTSGLTPGGTYWYDFTGTLSATQLTSLQFGGVALSATQIMVPSAVTNINPNYIYA